MQRTRVAHNIISIISTEAVVAGGWRLRPDDDARECAMHFANAIPFASCVCVLLRSTRLNYVRFMEIYVLSVRVFSRLATGLVRPHFGG